MPDPKEHAPTIRDLYPHLNEEQVKEAEEHFERYLELVLRIYERIRLDPDAYANFRALTGSPTRGYDELPRIEPS